jgi:hypothetical protein
MDIRAFRFLLPLAAAIGLLGAPTALGAHGHAPCAIPHRWKLVARDRQAVVIRQRGRQYPAYDYCNRAVRSGWRRLVTLGSESSGSFFQPASPLLAGRYVAYAAVSEPPQTTSIGLWDTRSGQHNTLTVGGFVAGFSLPTLLLSPNGVAAAIVVTQPYNNVNGQYVAGPVAAGVTTLTLHTQESLDSASPPTEISNLQLYDCATGCAPDTAVVAWTHSGERRYAQISP